MSLIKTARKKAISEAKRTAKDVSGEILEIPKSIPRQTAGEKSKKKVETASGLPKTPSLKGFDIGEDVKKLPEDVAKQVAGKPKKEETSTVVEAMQQTSVVEEKKPQVKKLTLEEEMKRLRKERERVGEEWKREQKQVMSTPSKPTKPGEPITLPPSSKKDPRGGFKKAQIETRKSKN